ncbi:copper resistance CopC family protein [Microbacterium sp. SLBN-146]|uniref:copper resistance CopC family protein n=1 Tax=Microbacterium sp. SLBN-146 TaxID=2768457 RepID=UPI00114FC173|nr:copper resistance CopC family protein [Microbacterium sp. SLBN-146]TQJ32393.1 hypothetical protein FBY39_2900 [Microbacterium sp. SLBN-146]
MSTAVGALPRRLLVLIAALLLAAASVVSTAAPAAAHDRLLGSDPAAESTVEQLPTTLSLTFSAAIAADAGASEVQVTDAAGAALTDGAPVVDGPILSQPLTQVTTAGPVTVLWKVVSSDGHPISGEFTFTVTSTPPAPTPTDTPTPTETPSVTSSPETPTESATPVPTDTDAASDSSSYVPWIIAAVLGALVVAATAYLIASRARRRRDGSQPPHPESEDPTDR